MKRLEIFNKWKKQSFTTDWEGCEPTEVIHVDDIKEMLIEMGILK
jgi:hypothetical protein